MRRRRIKYTELVKFRQGSTDAFFRKLAEAGVSEETLHDTTTRLLNHYIEMRTAVFGYYRPYEGMAEQREWLEAGLDCLQANADPAVWIAALFNHYSPCPYPKQLYGKLAREIYEKYILTAESTVMTELTVELGIYKCRIQYDDPFTVLTDKRNMFSSLFKWAAAHCVNEPDLVAANEAGAKRTLLIPAYRSVYGKYFSEIVKKI